MRASPLIANALIVDPLSHATQLASLDRLHPADPSRTADRISGSAIRRQVDWRSRSTDQESDLLLRSQPAVSEGLLLSDRVPPADSMANDFHAGSSPSGSPSDLAAPSRRVNSIGICSPGLWASHRGLPVLDARDRLPVESRMNHVIPGRAPASDATAGSRTPPAGDPAPVRVRRRPPRLRPTAAPALRLRNTIPARASSRA